ncbi:MAG: hypothetical protein GC129_05290 [Proteobacteria bacterium]|nr:hypothetical protein [Pseudomonadota bacterium]
MNMMLFRLPAQAEETRLDTLTASLLSSVYPADLLNLYDDHQEILEEESLMFAATGDALADALPVRESLPDHEVPTSAWWITDTSDPLHGRNLPAFHPESHNSLLETCLPTDQATSYTLIDAWVAPYVNRWKWRRQIKVDGSDENQIERYYIRRAILVNGKKSTEYLHRAVMRLKLYTYAEYRLAKCKQFGVGRGLSVAKQVDQLMQCGDVHHIHGNREDNRMAMLDLVWPIANQRQKKYANPCGYTGIVKEKKTGRFRARVQQRPHGEEKKRTHSVGTYTTARQAFLARCLFLLANPELFVATFTPAPHEAPVWAEAMELVEKAKAKQLPAPEQFPDTILVFITKARKHPLPVLRRG